MQRINPFLRLLAAMSLPFIFLGLAIRFFHVTP